MKYVSGLELVHHMRRLEYLDTPIPSELTNILKSDDNTHLYCGCSFEHDKERFISDEGTILFPKGIPHSTYCVSYIKEMLSLGAGMEK